MRTSSTCGRSPPSRDGSSIEASASMISRRALEFVTAALTGTFGAAVIGSSIDNGIGWSTAGVDAGTFPFLTGVVILIGSLWNLARGWPQSRDVVRPSGLRRLTALLVSGGLVVGGSPLIGVYSGHCVV